MPRERLLVDEEGDPTCLRAEWRADMVAEDGGLCGVIALRRKMPLLIAARECCPHGYLCETLSCSEGLRGPVVGLDRPILRKDR